MGAAGGAQGRSDRAMDGVHGRRVRASDLTNLRGFTFTHFEPKLLTSRTGHDGPRGRGRTATDTETSAALRFCTARASPCAGPGTGGIIGCFVSETLNICILHCMHELAMRLCLPCFASQVYCSIPVFFKQKINPRLSGSFVLLQNIGSEVTVT